MGDQDLTKTLPSFSGPGKYSVPLSSGETYSITHPFDGIAQIHRFTFNDPKTKGSHENKGRITYSSRYTSKGVEKRIDDGDETLLFFGQDTFKTVTQRITSVVRQVSGLLTGTTKKRWEEDPSSETVNITVTPNFPFAAAVQRGASTEVEWDDGSDDYSELGIVMKTDANMLQLLDRETLGKFYYIINSCGSTLINIILINAFGMYLELTQNQKRSSLTTMSIRHSVVSLPLLTHNLTPALENSSTL